MNVTINPARLSGEVRAISSKSAAHRSLICAALSDGPTELMLEDRSVDIDATIGCLRAMGASVEFHGKQCSVTPIQMRKETAENAEAENAEKDIEKSIVKLNCKESGSTLRFLLPIAAAVCGNVQISGEGRLPKRPLEELLNVLSAHGTQICRCSDAKMTLPLELKGRPQNGIYKIEGNVSSQYISGLLFALPLLEGDSRIQLLSPLESAAYVDMTMETLAQYGVQVEKEYGHWESETMQSQRLESGNDLKGFFIPGGQTYRSLGAMTVESDWSNAAFFLAAGAMGLTAPDGTAGGLTCTGLNLESTQGDKAIVQILRDFGAAVTIEENEGNEETDGGASCCAAVTVSPGRLRGMDIDVSQIPDLMPILAVTACRAEGKTVFCNAGRLRIKESDRIASVAAMINDLGGRAEEGTDSLTVYGTVELAGGKAESFGDHRIAMSAAVAALICRGPVTIAQAEAVQKSYPTFYEDYNGLGGKADVI